MQTSSWSLIKPRVWARTCIQRPSREFRGQEPDRILAALRFSSWRDGTAETPGLNHLPDSLRYRQPQPSIYRPVEMAIVFGGYDGAPPPCWSPAPDTTPVVESAGASPQFKTEEKLLGVRRLRRNIWFIGVLCVRGVDFPRLYLRSLAYRQGPRFLSARSGRVPVTATGPQRRLPGNTGRFWWTSQVPLIRPEW